MAKEFNLSEKIWITEMPEGKMVFASDIKEFIKLLKELNFNKMRFRIINDIDKLAGSKLS